MKVNASEHEVRKFGYLFGIIGLGLAAFSFYKQGHAWPWWLGGAGLFALGGLAAPGLLRPVYIVWMKFAHILGWVNTRLILGIFYYVILTPIGVVMRVTGWDPLTRRIDRSATSYWVKREPRPFDKESYHRLF